MNKKATVLLVLVVASCIFVSPIKAEAETLVVPDNYPTISSAIQNAAAGDTVFVTQGTYHEVALVIDKPIQLIGEGVGRTILNLDPPLVKTAYLRNWIWVPETAVAISANDVKLQGFTINLPNDNYGVGSAVYSVGDRVAVLDCQIGNRSVHMQGSMLNVTGNTLPATLEIVGSKQTITNNDINDNLKIEGSNNQVSANRIGSGNYFSGIDLKGTFNTLSGNWFSTMTIDDSNSNAIISNYFAKLDLREFGKGGCSDNIVLKNTVSGKGNFNDGIWILAGSNNIIRANHIRNCETGLTLSGAGSAVTQTTVYQNNFLNNTEHIHCLSSSNHTVNKFDNDGKGNFYDDYKGADTDGDGVGDSPYTNQDIHWDPELQREVTVTYYQDNYPLMAPVDLKGINIELPEWVNMPTQERSDSAATSGTLLATTVLSVTAVGVGIGLIYYTKRCRLVFAKSP